MADINTLQQQWEQHLGQIMPGKNAAVQQNAAYVATLEGLQNKVKQTHGLLRLRNPFIKVTKIAPLRHKQEKAAAVIAEANQQLAAKALDIFTSLGTELVKGSRYEGKYNGLQNAFEQTKKVQDIVSSASYTCGYIYVYGRPAAYPPGSRAPEAPEQQQCQNAIRGAQQALGSLQRQLGVNVPQIDSSFFNWQHDIFKTDVEKNIGNAIDRLAEIFHDLTPIMQKFSDEKMSLLTTVITKARKTCSPIDNLMESLETYLPANKPITEPALKSVPIF